MESGGGGNAAEEKTKASASACEIVRLPEELLSAAFSRTAPRDACRAAAVSQLFLAAADSDAVWSCFLPPDLPPLADGPPAPSSKKQLFMRLSNGPVLLADGLVSMWLDRESGAKCYMLSARALRIVWGSTPRYWRWIPLTDSRFAEAAELLDVCWLEFCGKMHIQMLTQNTKYAAYMVFKIADHNYGLDSPIQEAIVDIGEIRSTRQVCLQAGVLSPDAHAHVQFPQERADSWMELEMGEFFNEGADNGEVSITLNAIHGGHWKKGLIVHGIEIRVNPSASCQSDGSGEPDTHQTVQPNLNSAIGEPDTHQTVQPNVNPAIDEPDTHQTVQPNLNPAIGESDTHQIVQPNLNPAIGEPGTYQIVQPKLNPAISSQLGHRPRFSFGRLLRCFSHHSSVEGGASGSP